MDRMDRAVLIVHLIDFCTRPVRKETNVPLHKKADKLLFKYIYCDYRLTHHATTLVLIVRSGSGPTNLMLNVDLFIYLGFLINMTLVIENHFRMIKIRVPNKRTGCLKMKNNPSYMHLFRHICLLIFSKRSHLYVYSHLYFYYSLYFHCPILFPFKIFL